MARWVVLNEVGDYLWLQGKEMAPSWRPCEDGMAAAWPDQDSALIACLAFSGAAVFLLPKEYDTAMVLNTVATEGDN